MDDSTTSCYKKKDNEDEKSLIGIFARSSVIGVSKIFTTRSIIRKILWGAVLISGLILCAIGSYRLMVEFGKYPVAIDLRIENKGVLLFPAVTICNMNSIRKSAQAQVPAVYDHLPLTGETEQRHLSYLITPFRKEIVKCDQDGNSEKAELYDRYYSLNEERQRMVGHQIKDFVKSATFNSKPLSILNDFRQIINKRYGLCYIFNNQVPKWRNQPPYLSKTSRSQSGLVVYLNFELQEYVNQTESVGVRITIHSPYELPDAEGNGISVLPGMETAIAFKKTSIERLPFPYKDRCKKYNESGTLILNEMDCLINCLQECNGKECNCTDPTLNFSKIARSCNLKNNTEVCCLDRVFDQMLKDNFATCDCPLPCTSTKYETTTSASMWPSPASYYQMQSSYVINHSEFRQSYAKVNIYYSSLDETIYAQRPAYQNNEWYSQLGGQLGLWLGISLPSIFDCFEAILLLLHHAIMRCIFSLKLACNLLGYDM